MLYIKLKYSVATGGNALFGGFLIINLSIAKKC
jgi:hypothetical protein